MKRTKLKSIVMDIVGTSPEPIHEAFAFATFGPQPFWLLLIFLPKAEITKKIMGKLGMYLVYERPVGTIHFLGNHGVSLDFHLTSIGAISRFVTDVTDIVLFFALTHFSHL